ncbi:MAG: phosphate-starvation-inducible PsiE family protein, partial [Verrucomicrobia bacterium]|nr:phosphate-starvation-inducible PsiE family protein [Verrucomicrobiota bacterium]
LALLLWSELTSPPIGVLDVKEILELLGFFLMVLIAIEMIYVVRLFVEHRHLDVQAVLLVSLIAVARKVIVLDLEKYEAMHMLGIAALLLALAGALFLLRRCHAPVAPAS